MKVKQFSYFVMVTLIMMCGCASCTSEKKASPTLKEALKGKFHIEAAINADHFWGKDTTGVDIIKRHFDAIGPENCMKSIISNLKKAFSTLRMRTG